MRRFLRSILWLPILLALVAFIAPSIWAQSPTPTPKASPSPGGVVRGYLFYSPFCPHCKKVISETLPAFKKKYGKQLEITLLDARDPSNYAFLLAIEEQAKVPPQYRGVPFLVIGHHILIGELDIKEHLEEVIEYYLQQGGVDYLIPPDAIKKIFAPPTPTPTPSGVKATPTPLPLIHIAYFYTTGCNECEQAYYDLEYLKSQYPTLRIHYFDVQKDAPLWEWLGEKNHIPANKRLTTPAVFIGDDYLLGRDVNYENLEALVKKYQAKGAEPFWENWDREEALNSILNRFRSLGPLTVALAGLVDGLNPCAFATLIFFISYLALTGRKGWEVLAVGAAFALGVFFTYLGIGFGFLKALQSIPSLQKLSKVIYALTAVLCFALAAGNISDFVKVRKGNPEKMSLRMPIRLRRVVNRIVRQSMQVRYLVPISLITGLLISLIEFTCTGQVYLPTIIFMMGVPEMRGKATLYLMEYNLLFILPLVLIFVGAFFGTSSGQLSKLLNRHMVTIKAATAFLFLCLGAWLVYAVLIQ
ncbi:MAG: hypothetical protein DRI61_01805 [Chloroflexi bacterium]|nr:MAG: hypothetical protein DRI61_01805 [Chloroflexota bacterium]HDN80358.1 hypothetical protein [Chloroflexota bacterium]